MATAWACGWDPTAWWSMAWTCQRRGSFATNQQNCMSFSFRMQAEKLGWQIGDEIVAVNGRSVQCREDWLRSGLRQYAEALNTQPEPHIQTQPHHIIWCEDLRALLGCSRLSRPLTVSVLLA